MLAFVSRAGSVGWSKRGLNPRLSATALSSLSLQFSFIKLPAITMVEHLKEGQVDRTYPFLL